jgi:hypothetical protein
MRFFFFLVLFNTTSLHAQAQMVLILESFMQEHRGTPEDYSYSGYGNFYIASLDEQIKGLKTWITFDIKGARSFDPGLFREDLNAFLSAYGFVSLLQRRDFAAYSLWKEGESRMYITCNFPRYPKNGIEFEIYEETDNQEGFLIRNPSFEARPRRGTGHRNLRTLMSDWKECSYIHFPLETSPDISSALKSVLQNPRRAYNGNTYLVLVAYDSGQSECISQKLEDNLDPESFYQFNIAMARDNYLLKKHGLPAGISFNKPIGLAIYAGNSYCAKDQILYRSGAVGSRDWHTHKVNFFVDIEYNYLTLCAMQLDSSHVNGHLLLDHIHGIKEFETEKD